MNQTNKDLFSWLSLWTNKKLHWFPIIPIIKLPVGLLDQSNASLAQVTNQMLPIGSSDQSNASLAQVTNQNATLAQVANQNATLAHLTNPKYFLGSVEAVPHVLGSVGQLLKFRDMWGERSVALYIVRMRVTALTGLNFVNTAHIPFCNWKICKN